MTGPEVDAELAKGAPRDETANGTQPAIPRVSEAAGRVALTPEDIDNEMKKVISFTFAPIGETGGFTKQPSVREFGRLDDETKLIMAVARVRSPDYDGLFTTEAERRVFVHRLVNKGRYSGSGKRRMHNPVSKEELKELYDRAIESGVLVRKRGVGVSLTEAGLIAIAENTKSIRAKKYN